MKKGLRAPGLIVLCILIAAHFVGTTYAATITVTTATPGIVADGECSIIEAITNANNDDQSGSTDCLAGTGADTIILATDITLTNINNTSTGANGLPVITSDITIQSDSTTRTIARGANAPDFRFLEVASSSILTVDDLIFQNGSTVDSDPSSFFGVNGGAIFNRGTLTLNNSTLSGNSASDDGGAIFNLGTLTVSTSTLSGNSVSDNGGAIDNRSTLTVSNSRLTGNSANTDGGAIFNNAALTVSNSTLSGNMTNRNGGAILHTIGILTLNNSIIWNNSPDAIFNDSGTLTVDYSAIESWTGGGTGNITTGFTAADFFINPVAPSSAPTSAGDYALVAFAPAIDAASNTAATNAGIGATDLAGNTRFFDDIDVVDTGVGTAPIIDMGAYEFQQSSSCNTAYSFPYTMTGNTQTELVRAINCANANTTADTITLIDDVTLTAIDNDVDFGSLGETGTIGDPDGLSDGANGLPLITSEITIQSDGTTRTIARGASAPDFRLFAIDPSGTLTVNDLALQNGSAVASDRSNSLALDGAAGAIFNGGTLTVSNSTISRNSGELYAAMIFNYNLMTITNSVVSDSGGEHTILSSGTLTVSNSTFSQNRSGVILSVGTATMSNSTFSDNTSGSSSGAIDNLGGTMTVSNSTFSGNSFTEEIFIGAGAIVNHGTLTLNNNTFSGNSSANRGGAINNFGPLTVNNNTFSGNSANYGAVIYNQKGRYYSTDGTLEVNNSTFSGNSATSSDGVIVNDYPCDSTCTVAVNNSIIWDNSPNAIVNSLGNATVATVDYSAVEGWTGGGTGNITTGFTAADFFVNPVAPSSAPTTTGDYALVAFAPAIDAASNTAATKAGIGATDLAGNTRFADDIGVVDTGVGTAPIIDMGAYEFPNNSCATIGVTFPYTMTSNTQAELIQAIDCANANNTADTITLTGDVTLTAIDNNADFVDNAGNAVADGASDGANGLPLITSDITIQSDGTSRIIARGASAPDFRLFTITSGGTLTVDDLTLQNGSAVDSSPSLLDDAGGAIFNLGRLTVSNSTLSGNSANFDGGAIYNIGILTVSTSILSGNSSSDDGGAIYSNVGTLTVNNSTLSGNSANTDGGAIYNLSTMTVSNSTFSGNATSRNGGAIFHTISTLTMSNSIIWNNSPDAIFNDSGTVTVDYSAVEGWTGGGTGNITTGFMAADFFVTPVAPSSAPTTTGNYALVAFAPAIDAANNTAATNAGIGATDLAGNTRFADDIGVADTGDGTAPIIDIGAYEFPNNSCATIGVTFPYTMTSNTQAELIQAIDCANANNTADTITLTGDVILIDSDNDVNGLPVIASDIAVEGNNYTLERGYTHCDFSDADPDFRLLQVAEAGTLTLNSITLQNGCVDANGGAILMTGNLVLLNARIQNANGTSGGGIYASGTGTLTIVNSILNGNIASVAGGSLYCSGTTSNIINSLVYNNSAISSDGDAIRANCDITITNSTFTQHADNAIASDDGTSIVVQNSIFSDNGSFDLRGFAGSSVSVQNSLYSTVDIANGLNDLGGNITNQAPIFVDASMNDYRLISSSAGVNAGDGALLPDESNLLIDVDGDGNTDDPLDVDIRGAGFIRYFGPQVDMGAYEYRGVDVNGDGIVSPQDAITIINRIGMNGSFYDVDGDGNVDQTDVDAVISAFGTTP